jgi:hypothetical protein
MLFQTLLAFPALAAAAALNIPFTAGVAPPEGTVTIDSVML